MRLAMETQMLGAETVVLEARESIDRNNVIKLWAFVMEDLKTLGAKKLYPGLGCGAVNHIAIRQLQLLLLKMTLLLGVTVRVGEAFREILRPTKDRGWLVVSQKMVEGALIQVKPLRITFPPQRFVHSGGKGVCYGDVCHRQKGSAGGV